MAIVSTHSHCCNTSRTCSNVSRGVCKGSHDVVDSQPQNLQVLQAEIILSIGPPYFPLQSDLHHLVSSTEITLRVQLMHNGVIYAYSSTHLGNNLVQILYWW
jgi:hypothetical protein